MATLKPYLAMVVSLMTALHYAVGLDNDSMTPEMLLKQKLMANYDPTVRPVKNASEAVVVTMDLALTQIVDVEEKQQTIVSSVWLRFAWTDYFLKWNESQYGGVRNIFIKPIDVWVPDITLYSNVPTGQTSDPKEFLVKVQSDGTAHWYIPTLFVSTCKMEVQYFPYDIQTCKLKFGAWAYVSTELFLLNKSDSADLDAYESNGEWELMSADAERHSIKYNCCAEPYIDVTYYIKIKRKALYYTFNVVLPCMFFVVISPLTFLVSPGCGERLQLSITILLSLTVFLLFVAEQLPVQSEDVPLVGQYFMVAMLALVVANMASIVSVHLYHRGSKDDKLPRMVKLVAIKMAKLVGVADRVGDVIDKNDKENVELKGYDRQPFKLEKAVCSARKRNRLSKNNEPGNLDPVKGNSCIEQFNKCHCLEECAVVKLMYDINGHLAKLCKYKETSETIDTIKREWQMVAIVMDRCLVILSIVFILLFSLCFGLYDPVPE